MLRRPSVGRALGRRPPDGAARPGLRAGPGALCHPGAATTSPWPRSRRGGSWCRAPTCWSSWSPTGSRAAGGRRLGPGHLRPRRPDGRDRPAGRDRRGAEQRGALRRPRATRPPSTSSTPPAGWWRSTGATSTAATPRATSSPARRWPRSPRRSPGSPGCGESDARGAAAARPHPRGRRPVRPRPAPRPRPGRGALPGVRAAPADHDPRADEADAAASAVRGRDRRPLRLGPKAVVWKRLDDELEMIRGLGYASYFLTVGDVTDLIREMGVRCAARGSGAGSLVNYLLGVSGVDPVRHGLLMERFLSPLREALPDIDVDVESARRLEVYERILDKYGGERCVCVSMMDTYRVRHAVRDVGAALGMPPSETDTIAKAFPHIRARDARAALRELPELRASGLDRHPARPDVPARRAARRAAPARRHAPVRGAALRRHPARPDPGRGQLRRLPDEPVRQGRRRGPRPAQARRARHPDAVLDGPRGRRDQAHRRDRDRPRRRGAGAARRPGDLRR